VALSAGTQARRAAFAHMFFNLFGVVWVLIVFHPFVNMVCGLVGYDVEMTKASAGHTEFLANAAKLSFVLAAFHTCFNLINTGILIWFIPQIEKLVCYVIKPKKEDEEEDTRLQYIQGGLMKTPEISVLQAQKEITLFGERIQRMYGMVKDLLAEKDKEKFGKLFVRIEKYEGISDNMEIEIARYLEQVSDAHLSDETKEKIRGMLRQIGELESIGDSCFNLARILQRKRDNNVEFSEPQEKSIIQMYDLVDGAMSRMNVMLKEHKDHFSIVPSSKFEANINTLRNNLKQQNITDLDNHVYNYDNGTVYMDLVNEYEKVGDYVLNVAEASLGYSFQE
jgi:phosphate:Na+ symporter